MYEWENSDQENNEDEAENEGVLTTEQQKMKQVLAAKGKQIVIGLLENMSAKNQDNLEKTLNAVTILQEFCENDHCFSILTSRDALMKLITICCQGEHNKMNLHYALNLLQTIITEFSNPDKEIADDRKLEIQ